MRRIRIIDGDGIYMRHESKYMHDPELREAYKCGIEEGYEKAMREMGYNERRDYDREFYPRGGYGMRDDRDYDRDDYSERRRRDSRGRYM